MYTILVQMAQDSWSMQAVHLACAMARNTGGKVAVLRLMEVQYLNYLGTPLGNIPPTDREYARLKEYQLTAEDYGVELTVHLMQCATILDAVVEAADHLNAKVVFAQVPEHRISYWRRYQIWNLKRQLRNGHRQLYTLDQPVGIEDWTPSISVKTAALVK